MNIFCFDHTELTLVLNVCAANILAGKGAWGESSRTLHVDHASGYGYVIHIRDVNEGEIRASKDDQQRHHDIQYIIPQANGRYKQDMVRQAPDRIE
jgi:hypothetical protein